MGDDFENLDYPDWGGLGARVLAKQRDALEARDSLTHLERYDLEKTRKALAELAALEVARVRIAELAVKMRGSRMHPLTVVWFQMQELDKAGLTYDCLNPDDVEVVRKRMAEREGVAV